MFKPLSTRFATLAAAVSVLAVAGCDGADIEINGQKGVPLSEIEIAGPPPSEVVLASGDTVILTDGDTFSIKVEGPDTDSLRFVRDEDLIGITREEGWSGENKATIRITMPAPKELVIGGNGSIKAQSLASTAALNIGGNGSIEFASVAADSLEVNIGGNGSVEGAGTANTLTINIGGNGDVEFAGLKADKAEISIGGSGDVEFASDGTVEATIAGMGDVKVAGNAKCTVDAFGSGTLTCAPTKGGTESGKAIPAPKASGAAAAKPAE